MKLKPDYAEAWNNQGIALKEMGKLGPSVRSYEHALQFKPDYAEAYYAIARLKKQTVYDDDIVKMENLLGQQNINDNKKVYLHFALRKAFEELGQYDKAFNYLLNGNRIKRASFKYSISEDEILFKKLIDIFNKEFFDCRSDYSSSEDCSIFILGMPRSGTTLVEQILSSHHQVYGAGELNDLKEILLETNRKLTRYNFIDYVKDFDVEDYERFGAEYIKRINQYKNEAIDYVTDKMPSNFLYIGIIRVLFPKARIIHCKRGSVDTCLSCFKTNFVEGQEFTYGLTELVKYYRLYQNLMCHWDTVLPGYVFDFQYEELVSDPETQTKRLVDYCGLPWDENYLSFYKSGRRVKTASDVQVHRPIYKSSVQLWKRYEKQLGPLIKELEII